VTLAAAGRDALAVPLQVALECDDEPDGERRHPPNRQGCVL
jgi:hypothetical protein